jgi:hypothetical protein
VYLVFLFESLNSIFFIIRFCSLKNEILNISDMRYDIYDDIVMNIMIL